MLLILGGHASPTLRAMRRRGGARCRQCPSALSEDRGDLPCAMHVDWTCIPLSAHRPVRKRSGWISARCGMRRESPSLVPGPRDPKRNSTLGLVCGATRRRIVGERAERAQHRSPPPFPRSTTAMPVGVDMLASPPVWPVSRCLCWAFDVCSLQVGIGFLCSCCMLAHLR